jgi:sulfoxide reductase heme-binding subunit YedZ
MNDVQFNKLLIAVNAFVPPGMLVWDWYNARLGANPIEFVLSTTGVLTLSFLLLSLAVTPVRKLTGRNDLVRYRRMLGLFAFFYGCAHLVTYSIFDKSLDLAAIAADVWERPFIALGMSALAILLPLAVTSTNGMIKRLGGKRWQMLHRLVYVAGALGVAHFYLVQKSNFFWPIVYGIVLSLLLGFRLYARFSPGPKVTARA